jgi:hypothetical protein
MEKGMEVKVVPEAGQVVLREGKALELFQYKGFQYNADTMKSFAGLVLAKAKKESAIVFTNDKGFEAIIDDTVQDRPQDKVSYAFEWSVQAKEWQEILKGEAVFDIKDLLDFLKRRADNEIRDIDRLKYAIGNFRYVTKIDGDFSFADHDNYTFSIKKTDGEGTVRVPKVIIAVIEIFAQSEYFQQMEIEVEVGRPTDETKKPGVTLSCPKFERYLENAKNREAERLGELLEGYLIVAGSIA